MQNVKCMKIDIKLENIWIQVAVAKVEVRSKNMSGENEEYP